jgi:hypothetical protein
MKLPDVVRRPLPLVNGIPYTLHKLFAFNNIPVPAFTLEEKQNLI